MKSLRKALLLFCSFLLIFSVRAPAQSAKVVSGGIGRGYGEGGGVGFGGSVALGLPQAQTGEPYSAERQIETEQTLADGTHIVMKSRSRFWRDSAGRTRTEIFAPERPGAPEEPTAINIGDPVEGVGYYLTPSNRTGVRNLLHSMVPPRLPLKPAVNPTPPPPSRSMELTPLTNIEDLGTQMIQGVWARGSRQTITYPVNSQGNDRPIVVMIENWFSDELQTQVLSKRSDPRYGETVERLINIDRSEPDLELFRPPADYSITEPQRTN
jgi:hypothetical protein